jgi:hypothetical protein
MRRALAVLVIYLMTQALVAPAVSQTRRTHPEIGLNTLVRLPDAAGSSALASLVAIGFDNHIPMGIALLHGAETDACRIPLHFQRREMTMEDLINALEAQMAGYRARVENGVLNVIPQALPDGADQLLEIRIEEFRSAPGVREIQASDLWRSIMAVVAPSEGVNINQMVPLSLDDTVKGIAVAHESVRSILNTLVREGSGGIWVLDASRVRELTAETPMPYEVHGYLSNEDSIVSSFACSFR